MKKQMVLSVAASLLILAGCGNQPAGQTQDQQNQTQAADATNSAPADKVVKEIPVGDPVEKEGLEIAGVYFESSELFPHEKAGMTYDQADVHIEADIKATQGNKTGFGAGEWVPYLTVNYKLKNLENNQELSGTLMPMNAADGPHYGANVKLSGAGKYKFSISVESPEKQNYLLHIDKGSGVEGRFWEKPIEVEWEFPYVPKK